LFRLDKELIRELPNEKWFFSTNEYALAFRGTLAPSLQSGQESFRVLRDWLADGKIELCTGSDLSHALDDLVTRLESGLPVYAPCGRIQFIDRQDGIQPDSRELAITRSLSLAKAVAEFRLSEIIVDHSSGGGYCRVPCAAPDPAP
jgi:hypothetical protein